MTPLLRVLVAMPTRGKRSTTNTSCHFVESSAATAQPTTPPPIIKILTSSMRVNFVVRIILSLGRCARRNLVEKRYRFHQAGLGPVMHRVVGVLVFVVPR